MWHPVMRQCREGASAGEVGVVALSSQAGQKASRSFRSLGIAEALESLEVPARRRTAQWCGAMPEKGVIGRDIQTAFHKAACVVGQGSLQGSRVQPLGSA